jgi:hypothetical protein
MFEKYIVFLEKFNKKFNAILINWVKVRWKKETQMENSSHYQDRKYFLNVNSMHF